MAEYEVKSGRSLASTEWLTPPWMFNALGPFNTDPCAPLVRPWDIAKINYTVNDDGLTKKWEGTVWMNPPFGKGMDRWVRRLSEHGDGLAIIPLRSTDAKWFHECVFNAASAILFLRGRVRYFDTGGNQSGACPHASVVIAYGTGNVSRLKSVAKDPTKPQFHTGKLIELDSQSDAAKEQP